MIVFVCSIVEVAADNLPDVVALSSRLQAVFAPVISRLQLEVVVGGFVLQVACEERLAFPQRESEG